MSGFKKIFISKIMCMSLCAECVPVSPGTHGGQTRVSDLVALEIHTGAHRLLGVSAAI